MSLPSPSSSLTAERRWLTPRKYIDAIDREPMVRAVLVEQEEPTQEDLDFFVFSCPSWPSLCRDRPLKDEAVYIMLMYYYRRFTTKEEVIEMYKKMCQLGYDRVSLMPRIIENVDASNKHLMKLERQMKRLEEEYSVNVEREEHPMKRSKTVGDKYAVEPLEFELELHIAQPSETMEEVDDTFCSRCVSDHFIEEAVECCKWLSVRRVYDEQRRNSYFVEWMDLLEERFSFPTE